MVRSFQHIGKRKNQEDAFYIDENLGLYIVCDGMGGHLDGEIASQSVIKSIVTHLQEKSIDPICTNCIISAVRFAQEELNKISPDDQPHTKMGTTLALLYYKNGNAITAHLGDSRIIFLKNKANSIWSTKDHSIVQELFEAGVLETEEETYQHPLKNRITNAIIAGQTIDELKITTHDLRNIASGDIFLIFTDGILEASRPSEMQEYAQQFSVDTLMDKISEKVQELSTDNSTLIVLKI